ncbi:hypothetical protein GCM10027093_57760 [Paraburkholderia jirisanensis]
MSGDTYTASALLATDRTACVVLVKDTKGAGPYADKSDFIQKIYAESGVQDRVHLIDISAKNVRINDLWKDVQANFKLGKPIPRAGQSGASELDGIRLRLCQTAEPVNQWPRSITAVTGLLANQWSPATAETVARAWRRGTLPTDMKTALYEYMAGKFKGINFELRSHILVCWSRQSGKRGGAHIELDSSYAGIRQVAEHFSQSRATVLLAGDERGDHLERMSRDAGPHVIDVSNMWKSDTWADHFQDTGFLAQLAFFRYLDEEGSHKVIHFGMRSGMLEAMALMGMETFYLEPISSGSGDRMMAFQKNGITYERIQIRQVPTLTGQLTENNKLYTESRLNNFTDKEGKKLGIPQNNRNWALAAAKARNVSVPVKRGMSVVAIAEQLRARRGFSEDDLNKITTRLEQAMANA